MPGKKNQQEQPQEQPAEPVRVQLVDAEAERLRVAAEQQASDRRLDETVEGGRYEVNGQTVNANGKPIKDKK